MNKRSPRPPYRVQIVADPGWEYFREAVLGARHYGFETGRLEFADRWLDHELRGDLGRLVESDGIQGIVATLHTPALERRFAKLPVPVVNVSNGPISSRVPLVTQDDEAVGRLAAAHLLACGCRNFGFWGDPGTAYSEQRLSGFRTALAEAGFSTAIGLAKENSARWAADLRVWLSKLPRPVGVFGVNDTHALAVIRSAHKSGLRVPEDVAVLGAGDENFWVDFERVPLSSIKLPPRAIGYEAAALLDRLITGKPRNPSAPRLPVTEVAQRRSTDIIFCQNAAVGRALRYIREHALENPYVEDVARAAGVSRSQLKAVFRREVGRTVLGEIQRIRVRRAQSLLTETDLPMSRIAEVCGFPDSPRFTVRFRKATGTTPSAYRKKTRLSHKKLVDLPRHASAPLPRR